MHALIIADNSFATRERAMLSRLEVGLADEGVRVTHAVPTTLAASPNPSDAIGIQSTIVTYRDAGLPFTLRSRAAALAAAIDSRFNEPTPIDIIHAFGLGSWPIAAEIAKRIGTGLLLELWRPDLVAPAAGLHASCGRTKPAIAPEFIVSEGAVATALHALAPRAKVYSAPWGVHAPPHARPTRPADQPLAIAILCDTGDPRFVTPALAGLVDATKGADTLVFAAIEDATHARDAALWAAARKLNLLDRFSLAPDMESRREPILDMDVLIFPESGGRQRTLTLEAMGAGMLVLALAPPSPDDTLETLIDGTTAKLVRQPTQAAWSEAIRSTVLNPAAATDLSRAAHEHIRSNRSASTHVADVLRAYQQAARAPVVAE